MNQNAGCGQILADMTFALIKEGLPNVLPKMWHSGSGGCRILP